MSEEKGPMVTSRRSHKDHGYAWVVLVCVFLLSSLTSGTFVSYGIFFPEFIDYFGKTKAEVAVIGSLGMGIAGFIGAFLGTPVKRFGYRVVLMVGCLIVVTGLVLSSLAINIYMLFATYGILLGFGLGCYNISGLVAIMDYFNKRRSFALGVQAGGYGLGVFGIPQLVRFMIDTYSWRGGILLYGGVQMHVLILAVIMKPSPKPKPVESNDLENHGKAKNRHSIKHGNENVAEKKTCNFSIKTFIDYTLLKDPNTLLLFTCVGLSACSHFMPQLLLPARMMSYGISKSKATFIISIFGLCSIFSRPLAGLIADRISSYRFLLVAFCSMAVGLLGLISYFFKDYVTLAVIFGLCGLLSAGYVSLYGALMADTIPANKVEHGSGLLLAFFGLAILMATPFAGFLVDSTGDYATPFLVLGGVQVAGGCLFVLLYFLQKRKARKLHQHITDVRNDENKMKEDIAETDA